MKRHSVVQFSNTPVSLNDCNGLSSFMRSQNFTANRLLRNLHMQNDAIHRNRLIKYELMRLNGVCARARSLKVVKFGSEESWPLQFANGHCCSENKDGISQKQSLSNQTCSCISTHSAETQHLTNDNETQKEHIHSFAR